MKIAHLSLTSLPATVGGKEIVVHNIVRQQATAGHQVVLITNWKQWTAARQLNLSYKSLPIRVRLGCHGNQDCSPGPLWWSTLQLMFYQALFRFDIWHVHTAFPAGYLALSALKKLKVPFVVTSHGDDILKFPDTGYGYRLNPKHEHTIQTVLCAADAVTAVSETVRQEYLSLGVHPDHIIDVPNGVDIDRIRDQKVDRQRIRDLYGIPQQSFFVLTVGRNDSIKGLNQIPTIARHVAEKVPNLYWLVVGRDTELITEDAKQVGLVGRLKGLGPIASSNVSEPSDYRLPNAELIALYKSADAFLLPSHMESFGMVLVEAMAAGLPVVARNVPGCRDVIKNNENGLLAAACTPADLAEKLIELAEDNEIAPRLTTNSRQTINQYRWENVSKKYEFTYKAATRRH